MITALFAKRMKRTIIEDKGSKIAPDKDEAGGGKKTGVGQALAPGSPAKMKIRRGPARTEQRHHAAAQKAREQMPVDDLISQMRTGMSGLRNKLTDVEEMNHQLKTSEVELQMAMGDSQDAQDQLNAFREEMEGDFALTLRKEDWAKAADAFLDAALGRNEAVNPTTPNLSAYLCECLEKAEPSVTPCSAAVVAWHPASHDLLKVFHATEGAELRIGQNLRPNATDAASQDAFKVMNDEEQFILTNAHGLERDSKAGRSVVPLKSISGMPFACLVNGPPAVPDELLDSMARLAGPLLERVWKHEKACEAAYNVISFMKQATMDNHQLIYCSFKKGAKPAPILKKEVWDWRPLSHRPNADNKWEFAMKWSLGDPIGILEVSCGSFTEMNESLVQMLSGAANVLQHAIDELEHLVPGDTPPLATVSQVLAEYERLVPSIPQLLQMEIAQNLRTFDGNAIFAEVTHFDRKAIDDEQLLVLQSVLVLLGNKKKDVKDFNAAMKKFKKAQVLTQAMIDLPLNSESASLKKRWDDSYHLIRSLKLKNISERSPAPIVVLLRWMETVRQVHTISQATAATSKPPPPDPIADKIFDLIDANGDGTITPPELVTYLLKEFPSSVAHTLLRVTDTDQSGQVTREEWRKAWASGLLSQLLIKEHAKTKKDSQPEGARLRSKRESGVMALTAAAAAEQYRALHGSHDPTDPTKSSAAKNNKKKLPPIKS